MNIYRQNILEHYKNPDNSENLSNYDIKTQANNPSCGDEIEIKIKLDNNRIKDAKFNAKGCAISIASADILLENLKNKPLSYIKKLGYKDIIKFLGTELTPSRMNCAMLSLNALKLIK